MAESVIDRARAVQRAQRAAPGVAPAASSGASSAAWRAARRAGRAAAFVGGGAGRALWAGLGALSVAEAAESVRDEDRDLGRKTLDVAGGLWGGLVALEFAARQAAGAASLARLTGVAAGAGRVAFTAGRVGSPIGWAALAGEGAYLAYSDPDEARRMGMQATEVAAQIGGAGVTPALARAVTEKIWGGPSPEPERFARREDAALRRAYLDRRAQRREITDGPAPRTRSASGPSRDKSAPRPDRSAERVSYTTADGVTGQYTREQIASFRQRRRRG